MNKKLYWLFGSAVAIAGVFILFRLTPFGTELLWNMSRQGEFLGPLVAVAALIDSINPCAFSVLLLTIAFLFSLGRMRSKVLLVGLTYILGLFTAYLLIGLGLLQVLHLFDTPHVMARIGAGLLIVLGVINLLGVLFPRFPIRLRIPHGAHRAIARLINVGSIPVAFVLGGLVGLCEFPCTGGPYLLVLGLLHDQATYMRGFGYLVLYNLIFVAPLVIVLMIAAERTWVARVQKWQKTNSRALHLWAGAAMLLLGALILLL